jgi:hypothetical protein
MTIQQLSKVLAEWLSRVMASVLPKVTIQSTSGIGKVMNGLLGIDLSTYNVWNELGFLSTPIFNNLTEPMLQQYLAFIPQENIKTTATDMVKAMIAEAERKGHVNLFGVEIGRNAFDDLLRMLEAVD